VAKRNKLLAGSLFFLISAQLCFGIFATIKIGLIPCKFFNRLFVRVRAHSVASPTGAGYKLRRVQGLPSRTVAYWGARCH